MKKQIIAAVALLFVGTTSVVAQSNEDINSVLQFNFSNPGARSLGMGGAFTARADDATAVYANPAGLIQLSRPEIAADGRGWGYHNRFLAGGIQQDPASLAGLNYAESDDSVEGLSFLSGFYPSKSGRWTAGIFRHQAINFETALATIDSTVFTPTGTGFARPRDGYLDLELDTTGFAFAARLNKTLSVGVTVTEWDFFLDSRLELYDSPRDQEFGDPIFNTFSLDAPYPGLTEGDPDVCCEFGNRGDIIRFRTQQGKGSDRSLSVGLFWQSQKTRAGVPWITLGGVYRAGPTFRFEGRSLIRGLVPSVTLPTTRVYQPAIADATGFFKIPDVWSMGASVRPSANWVWSLDWTRVEYTDLTDRFLDIAARDSGIPDGQVGRPVDYRLQDGDEIRLGVEYAAGTQSRRSPIFIRGGLWHDPNHEIEYVGPDPSQRALFSPGSDELHASFGVGLKWRDIQFDVAYDYSPRIETLSFSTVWYFGRN